MDNSAHEALYTGVYVFIFITALSLTIFLFKTVNDYADLSYRYGQIATEGTIIENVPVEKNRLIKGNEVLSYYYNYIKQDMYGEDKQTLKYTLQISTTTGDSGFLNANSYTYYGLVNAIKLEEFYILKYTKVENGQVYVTIRKATKAEIDEKV